MIRLEDYEGMIRKMAWDCYRRIPNYYYSIEELEQEGRLVFTKLLKNRLRLGGASFSTLLFKSLLNHYASIVRMAYTDKRIHERSPVWVEDLISGRRSQHDLLEIKEILDYIRIFDEGLADYFLHGPSEEFIKFARKRADNMAQFNGKEKARRVIINTKCIEEYFGFKFKDLVTNFNIGRIKINSK